MSVKGTINQNRKKYYSYYNYFIIIIISTCIIFAHNRSIIALTAATKQMSIDLCQCTVNVCQYTFKKHSFIHSLQPEFFYRHFFFMRGQTVLASSTYWKKPGEITDLHTDNFLTCP